MEPACASSSSCCCWAWPCEATSWRITCSRAAAEGQARRESAARGGGP